jgi:hypothetical protein
MKYLVRLIPYVKGNKQLTKSTKSALLKQIFVVILKID